MLVKCYRCRMTVLDQDPLSIYVQRKGGWMSVGYGYTDYYVPEEYAYMLYVYDSNIERRARLDYIV
jgi:hypothetical protein